LWVVIAPVAIATCAALPGLDEEGQLLQTALAAQGIRAVAASWNDSAFPWERCPAIIVRSTWDYYDDLRRFSAWVASLAGRVLNPGALVAWNAHKGYLSDLAAVGIPVVHTRYVAPGEPYELPSGRVVIKPAISAGANGAAAHDDRAAAGEHIRALHAAGRTVMIQPYLESADAETAVVFIDGEVSHGMRKGPMLSPGEPPESGLWRPEDMSRRLPTRDMLRVARAAHDAVVARFGTIPLYARADLLRGRDGAPLLLELELIEPSLWLRPDSAERLAAAISRRHPSLTRETA
jgi:hypothetical protein